MKVFLWCHPTCFCVFVCSVCFMAYNLETVVYHGLCYQTVIRSSLGYGPESSASRAVCADTDFCFS